MEIQGLNKKTIIINKGDNGNYKKDIYFIYRPNIQIFSDNIKCKVNII